MTVDVQPDAATRARLEALTAAQTAWLSVVDARRKLAEAGLLDSRSEGRWIDAQYTVFRLVGELEVRR